MIYRPNDTVIARYHGATNFIGQSTLKDLLNGVDIYNEKQQKEEEDKKHFMIGSAVDCWITEGEDAFNEQYYTSTAIKPAEKTLNVINGVYREIEQNEVINPDLHDSDYDSLILEQCDIEKYYGNRKDETRIKGIKEFADYFESLIEGKGKKILTGKEYETVYAIYNSLTTHEFTKLYCGTQLIKNIDLVYQLPLYFTYRGLEMKSLLDLLIINHSNKTLIPVDFKTMHGHVKNFPDALRMRRYDIQGATYTIALRRSRETLHHVSILRDKVPVMDKYEISNFRFVVESSSNVGKPAVFIMSNDLLKLGVDGRDVLIYENNVIRKELLGLNQLVDKYKWHLENGFTYDENMVNSPVTVDWEGITG